MKKTIIIMLLFCVLLPSFVSAKNIYFTNQNNVSLTEEEYNYVIQRTWDGFQNIMTIEDYNVIVSEELLNVPIEKTEYTEFDVLNGGTKIMMRNAFYSTSSKSISLSKACSGNYCSISIVARWLKNPTIRSYDVIGAYFSNAHVVGNPITTISSSAGTSSGSALIKQNKGFGVSVKLPSSGSGIVITQNYKTTRGGSVWASYQHAKSNTTLANSKKYTIANNGYGGVFLFNSGVAGIYDAMSGVTDSL